MAAPKTLRFRARGESLVPHYESLLNQGIKRFVGRRFDPTIGEPFKDDETGEERKSGGFVSTGETEEVPYRFEYVRECQAGCLWPADEATAKACDLKFDPSFGAPATSAKSESK
jgi:hypothetical protein